MADQKLIYGLEDRPPWARLFLYGLQWTLMTLPIVAISTNLAAEYMGYQGAMKAALGQRFLILVGLTMIVQSGWGHKLPLIDGPAGALLLLFITLAPYGEGTVRGAMLAGGIILAVASHLGLIGRLEKYFTADTVGTVILLIAFATLPFLLPLMLGQGPGRTQGDPSAAGLALGLALLIPALGHWLSGLGKSLSVFICLIIGTAVFALTGRVAATDLAAAPWFGLPLPWPPSTPTLNAPALAAAVLAYLVVILNLKGSLAAVMSVVGGGAERRRMKRSSILFGWTGALSGVMGVYGPVAYAYSPGVILATGVGSRFTTLAAGGIMLGLGFCSKLAALLTLVPLPVIAAALVAALSGQIGSGLNLIFQGGRVLDGRDFFIIGLPLLLGTLASLISREFIALLPPLIGPLAGNGMVVGLVCLILLERILLRKK